MKELRVEDALLYLDQVKVEFGDRPQIYNEFLDIMKTFKTQQIDTPGVIRRVSNLFQGNRRLVLGFNTFLPEGYKIELPADGEGPPVAVFRAPGSTVTHVLNAPGTTTTSPAAAAAMAAAAAEAAASQQQPPPNAVAALAAAGAAPAPPGVLRVPTAAVSQLHNRALPLRGTAGAGPPPPPQPPFGGAAGGGPSDLPPTDPNAMLRLKAGAGQPPAAAAQPPRTGFGRPTAQTPQQQQQPLQALSQAGGQPVDGKLPPGPVASANLQPPPAAPQAGEAAAGPVRFGDPQAAAQQQQQQAGQPQPPGQPQQQQVSGQGPPLEFDHAINYVTTIKKRFANEPETYKKFLEILHTYQKEQRGIKEVLDEVSVLFADHADLLKQFTYFLPDAVQAQAKQQLDEVAKEAEARKRSQAKQAIMHQAEGMQKQAQRPARSPPVDYDRVVHVPFGATQGRSVEDERAIIESAQFGTVSFAPVRPPKPTDPKKAKQPNAAKQSRPKTIPVMPMTPNAAETAFFYRIKHHLSRKELSPEKPVGSKRHTPYVEFIKCLHLFGAGILNKEELLLLLRGLLTQGHAPKTTTANNPQIASDAADLLREFEQVLIGRGPYATQESSRADKSKYGTCRARDMDLDGCAHPTPSYWAYPKDYPASVFLVHPSRHHLEAQMLNDSFTGIPAKRSRTTDSLEVYDGIKKRHNTYEEAMARIEDERYEVDMAIARNAQALVQIEPLAQECLRLRQGEEKDGQPIGRLQYQIKRRNAITSVVINAIGRVYGDRGDEVVQHMARNPLIVLPIVYQRLKQKHDEWRKVRDGCKEQWSAITEANYEGCMDTRCYFRRRELESSLGADNLVDQCKRAEFHWQKEQRMQTEEDGKLESEQSQDNKAGRWHSYRIGLADTGIQHLFFEPCITTRSVCDFSHKDAFTLLALKVKRSTTTEPIDVERIGRIWAEFMVPWYGYPANWVREEIRQSFSGRLSQSVVKFALGQKVKTIYGEGSITQFETGRYRVKFSWGVAYLAPTAILHSIPSKDAPYVRRDGKMERDTTNESTKTEGSTLDPACQVLFATRRIYLFLRLHLQLCNILCDLGAAFDGPAAVDPATNYVVAPGESPNVGRPSERLDYAGMLKALKSVILGRRDHKTYETFCRKISREHVHVMAALPKLIEKCAEALISLAKEDALLHLYDYCQYRELNPSIVREHCFSMAPDADFRVQSDGKMTAFSYLPRGESLPTVPQKVSVDMDASSTSGSAKVAPMDIDEEDDASDMSDEPLTKRVKTK